MVFCIELKRVEVTLSGAIEKSRGEVDEGRWMRGGGISSRGSGECGTFLGYSK
jgi:hypothetical protein